MENYQYAVHFLSNFMWYGFNGRVRSWNLVNGLILLAAVVNIIASAIWHLSCTGLIMATICMMVASHSFL
jgi:hypothetical protein